MTTATRQARKPGGRVSLKANVTPEMAEQIRRYADDRGISESGALGRLASEALSGRARERVIDALRCVRDLPPERRREMLAALMPNAPKSTFDEVLVEGERMSPV